MEIVVVTAEPAGNTISDTLSTHFAVTSANVTQVPGEIDDGVNAVVLDWSERARGQIETVLTEVPAGVQTVVVADPAEMSPGTVFEAGADGFVDGTGPETAVRVRKRLQGLLEYTTEPGLPDRRDELGALIENAPMPIGIVDADGEIVYANEAAAAFVNADTPSRTEGESVFSFASTEAEPNVRSRVKQVIDDRVPTDPVVLEFVGVDGEKRTAVVTTTPIRYEGEPAGQFVLHDITDHKRQERKLRQFKQAVEDAGHAIFITAVDGRITYVNRAFETITGFSASEAIGETPNILKSGEHDDGYYEQLWDTILSGETWEEEVVNARKDGELYHAKQTISPITDGGEVTRFVAIQQDITALKEYERELETRNEQLERFASVVSHDLRNPLNVATGRVELARDRLDSEPDLTRDSLAVTISALDRIERIIDDLLSLARDGDVVGDHEPVVLGSIAETCFSHVSSESGCLHVEDGQRILADQGRLRSLLENLFRNAVEHGGADVVIHVGLLEEDGGTDGFYVVDDGPGIPPEKRDEVFEPGESGTEIGTGLGLSIVKRIAQAHGWTVSVTESADGGARFEIRGVDTPSDGVSR